MNFKRLPASHVRLQAGTTLNPQAALAVWPFMIIKVMRKSLLALSAAALLLPSPGGIPNSIAAAEPDAGNPGVDWLVTPVTTPVSLRTNDDGRKIVLSNGLISRSFNLSANLACVSFKNLSSDAEFLRAVGPEARVNLSGHWFDIGGLNGQRDYGFLDPAWLNEMTNDP